LPGQDLSQGHQDGAYMGRLHDGKSIWHIVKDCGKRSICLNWRLMTCGGRVLACATLQEANWSRSSSCWDMSRFKQPSDTLAASTGFGRRSMIASESNQIAESPGFWKCCRPYVQRRKLRRKSIAEPQRMLTRLASAMSVLVFSGGFRGWRWEGRQTEGRQTGYGE
jgi:hypothetical protein